MITRETATRFAREMERRFNARIVSKNDAVEMRIIAAALDVARTLGASVPTAGDFLERTATTIGPLIYVPDSFWDDPAFLVEIITHECQHVWQFWHGTGDGHANAADRDLPGGFGFAWLYLVEPEARVRIEAEAYAAGMEARTIGLGEPLPPSLDALAMPLEGGYALGREHIVLGRALLESAATTISHGAAMTEAGQRAIEVLRMLGVRS